MFSIFLYLTFAFMLNDVDEPPIIMSCGYQEYRYVEMEKPIDLYFLGKGYETYYINRKINKETGNCVYDFKRVITE